MKSLVPAAILFSLALALCLFRNETRGAMWPDSPRYANAAAMIHDWFHSGDLAHPLEFAEKNYYQYPAFNIPYHPPGYPGLVGVFFLITGVSYAAMKTFVALCWAGCVISFYVIQRRFGSSILKALLVSIVFLTTPELLRWSRDTMSEIPGLFFFFASTLLYLNWLDGGRARLLAGAFALLAIAVQCRLTVVGLFPSWVIFALLTGRGRRAWTSPTFIILTIVFTVAVGLWVKWVSGYARFEVQADGREEGLSWRNLLYFTELAGQFFRTGGGPMLLGGLLLFVAIPRPDTSTRFWLAWLIAATAFKILVPTTLEPRHFLLGLPAFIGLGGRWLMVDKFGWPFTGALLCLSTLALNFCGILELPRGLLGYEPIAIRLAETQDPGNLFLACPHDQDLIFRYRSHAPDSRRLMIRSDRTISTRVAEYAKKEPTHHLTEPGQVLELLRKGRVRYLLITRQGDHSPLPFDWELTSRTVREFPDRFEELTIYSLRVEFEPPGYDMSVTLYRFKEELRPGPSEIQLSIPTAGISKIENRASKTEN